MYSGHFPVQLTHLSSQFCGIFLYHVICSFCFYCSESPWANAWLPVFHSSHAVSTCSLALGRKGTPLGVSLFLSVCSWLPMLWLKLQKGPASVPRPQLCISSTSTLAWPTWTPPPPSGFALLMIQWNPHWWVLVSGPHCALVAPLDQRSTLPSLFLLSKYFESMTN